MPSSDEVRNSAHQLFQGLIGRRATPSKFTVELGPNGKPIFVSTSNPNLRAESLSDLTHRMKSLGITETVIYDPASRNQVSEAYGQWIRPILSPYVQGNSALLNPKGAYSIPVLEDLAGRGYQVKRVGRRLGDRLSVDSFLEEIKMTHGMPVIDQSAKIVQITKDGAPADLQRVMEDTYGFRVFDKWAGKLDKRLNALFAPRGVHSFNVAKEGQRVGFRVGLAPKVADNLEGQFVINKMTMERIAKELEERARLIKNPMEKKRMYDEVASIMDGISSGTLRGNARVMGLLFDENQLKALLKSGDIDNETYNRLLLGGGHIKGDALVRGKEFFSGRYAGMDIVTSVSNAKTEIGFTGGKASLFTFQGYGRSTSVLTDVQSLSAHGHLFNIGAMGSAAKAKVERDLAALGKGQVPHGLIDALERMSHVDDRFLRQMTDEQRGRVFKNQAFAENLLGIYKAGGPQALIETPGGVNSLIRAYYKSMFDTDTKGNIIPRLTVPNAMRGAATSVTGGTGKNLFDQNIADGAVFWDSRSKSWVFSDRTAEDVLKTLGGGDLDDKVLGLLRMSEQGDLRAIFLRQPNTIGEIYDVAIDEGDKAVRDAIRNKVLRDGGTEEEASALVRSYARALKVKRTGKLSAGIDSVESRELQAAQLEAKKWKATSRRYRDRLASLEDTSAKSTRDALKANLLEAQNNFQAAEERIGSIRAKIRSDAASEVRRIQEATFEKVDFTKIQREREIVAQHLDRVDKDELTRRVKQRGIAFAVEDLSDDDKIARKVQAAASGKLGSFENASMVVNEWLSKLVSMDATHDVQIDAYLQNNAKLRQFWNKKVFTVTPETVIDTSVTSEGLDALFGSGMDDFGKISNNALSEILVKSAIVRKALGEGFGVDELMFRERLGADRQSEVISEAVRLWRDVAGETLMADDFSEMALSKGGIYSSAKSVQVELLKLAVTTRDQGELDLLGMTAEEVDDSLASRAKEAARASVLSAYEGPEFVRFEAEAREAVRNARIAGSEVNQGIEALKKTLIEEGYDDEGALDKILGEISTKHQTEQILLESVQGYVGTAEFDGYMGALMKVSAEEGFEFPQAAFAMLDTELDDTMEFDPERPRVPKVLEGRRRQARLGDLVSEFHTRRQGGDVSRAFTQQEVARGIEWLKAQDDGRLAKAREFKSLYEAAVTSRSDNAKLAQATMNRFSMEWLGNFFRGSPIRQGVAAGVAGLAALGIVRSVRNKDRTPEDIVGNVNMPGGNPYVGPMPGHYYQMAGNSVQEPGPSFYTYEVRTRGERGLIDSFLGGLSGLTAGASVTTSMYDVPDMRGGSDFSILEGF